MKIEHIAIWARDIENLRLFYIKYFNASSNEKYINQAKKYSSYFLSFESGTRLEIMQMDSVEDSKNKPGKNYFGITHLAFSVGSKEKVDSLTNKILDDGYTVLDGPRTTGDGYYESKILDPECNQIEISI